MDNKGRSAGTVPGVPVPAYPIESVDNALKILLLLRERSELRMTEVSEYLGVASSTAHRMLAMLQYRGFLRQDPRTKAYLPGTSLTSVAFAILQRFDFRSVLRPFLQRLNTELRETVCLAMLEGSTVRFIDDIESPQVVRVASRLGKQVPASSSSSGKAMLAQLSTEELHTLYPGQELPALTENSIRTRDELEVELKTVRARGYAVSAEESEQGVTAVAVAFPMHGARPRLAFTASIPSSRVSPADRRTVGEQLRAAVDEAAGHLHG